jgi:IPT/TIG domain
MSFPLSKSANVKHGNRARMASSVLIALLSINFIGLNSSANSYQDGVCSLMPGIASGVDGSSVQSGSSSNPVAIANETQLRELAECTQLDSSATQGVSYSLVSDIPLQDAGQSNWTPIGQSNTNRFLGTFSGGGHSISGIRVGDLEYSGLFGAVGPDAVIQNLSIQGTVSGKFAGLVAGSAKSGAEFVSISADVEITSTQLTLTDSAIGGILGVYDGNGSPTADRRLSLISDVRAEVSGSANHMQIGGLLGAHDYYSGTLRIESSKATLFIRNTQASTGDAVSTGGLIGKAESTRIYRSSAKVSVVTSDFGNTSTGASPLHRLGGLIGDASHVQILESFAKSSITAGGRSGIGGLIGEVDYGTVGWPTGTNIGDTGISGSYAVSIFREKGTSQFAAGGLVGTDAANAGSTQYRNNVSLMRFYKEGSATRIGGVVGYDAGTTLGSSFVSNQYWSKGTNMATKAIGITDTLSGGSAEIPGSSSLGIQESAFGTAGSFSGLDISSAGFDASKTWSICNHPYLTWQGSDDCGPEFLSASLGTDGRTVTLESFTALQSASYEPSRVSVKAESTVLGLTGNFSGAGSVASFSLATQQASSAKLFLTLENDSGAGQVLASDGTTPFSSITDMPISNRSTLTGPVALLGTALTKPSTIDVGLSCGGTCGSANAFSYTATITPSGGQPSTISGTASTTTTTLSFTALSANVAHTIRASVSYNGQTSATVSTTVTTARPLATISSVVVTETTATLGVGCINCGASPDSFTISATPQAGGAAITSNTSVIAGLSSETTYSFAVVIAYAGTTSAVVNWQGNPVRTNPYSPVITNVSPSSGPLSGGLLTVTGSNFSTSDQLTFAGVTVSFSVVSGTTITFTAPAGTAGAVDLAIRNPAGTGSFSNAFTYVPAPSLTSISPSLATINGGTVVTLRGTNLSRATEINLGSATLSVTVVSSAELRFVTPATSAGIVDVGVVTPGGVATLSQALEFTTSALVPIVTSITPSTGPISGGTTITVMGQYFSGSYSDAISVAINGVSGSAVLVLNDSTLTFVSPAGAAAAGLDVTVFTGGGLGTLVGAFSYTAPPQSSGGGGSSVGASSPATSPEISSFSVRILGTQGGTVTISGRRLSGISLLSIGGVAVSVTANSDTEVTFATSNLPTGMWDLVLINGYGKLTFLQAITVIAPPVVIETSIGELLSWRWTPKFEGNSRTLNAGQKLALDQLAQIMESPTTIVCWGYTTSKTPNSWALNHATSRAQAVCDYLSEKYGVKTVVRIRYGSEKSHAMRAAIQFWK